MCPATLLYTLPAANIQASRIQVDETRFTDAIFGTILSKVSSYKTKHVGYVPIFETFGESCLLCGCPHRAWHEKGGAPPQRHHHICRVVTAENHGVRAFVTRVTHLVRTFCEEVPKTGTF
jgi:hypothetical protein